ncbi:unnamed protein product [Rotaria socialis]|uniref:Uncharacterized protein n=3 Tax=Rotaria socialis TaxID=392032 RepID=A0A819X1E0_9BILA|nr:unnamed protein product [Rotaria socialis]
MIDFFEIGRHSKSKSAGTSSSPPINDLSSATSSSSSSLLSNSCSSSIEPRKKTRSYRLASPTQTAQNPPISDDSLSEKSERLLKKKRPHSSYTAIGATEDSSQHESLRSIPPSVYLIELKNNTRPTNSFGLTKTITYVWKSSSSKKDDERLYTYPKYTVEQVSPMIDQDRRSIPVSSRHITLQRGKIDYWENMRASPDSVLTSSCQNHIGSASNLLSLSFENQPKDARHNTNAIGHVISVTTTKRRQPSLLNQTQNSQWNIEGDGKQLRYSNLKWYSVDQLQKDNRHTTKQRIKRKYQQELLHTSDSATDTGSSSDQHNRSAPPILQRTTNTNVANQNHEVFETILMNKQTDSTIPDYSSFNREVNDASSPVKHNEIQQTHSSPSSSSSSSSSKDKLDLIEKIIKNECSNSSSKRKLNSYASTDEDVDEFNLDYSDGVNRSATTTIQTYRDRLNARLNPEQLETNSTNRKFLSTECSQVTIDSGVDIASEQKLFQLKIDEQYSEETTNQNDLFALSDDSLLDIESPYMNDLSLKPSFIIKQQQLRSYTDDSEGGRSYLTAITDIPSLTKTDRVPSNTSEQYYSADSDFNTSLSLANNDIEFENQTHPGQGIQELSPDQSSASSTASPIPPEIDSQLPAFGDWIDGVFTAFLAETNQQSNSTSRSSSILSVHISQHTIDTSSSQVLTVIENNKNHPNLTIMEKYSTTFDDNNRMNSSHGRSQSSPNGELQKDDANLKEMSISSLNNENNNDNSYKNVNNCKNISTIDAQVANKQSTSLLLSSIESGDDEVINRETMQNDKIFSLSNTTTNNIDVGKVKEKEQDDDTHHIEIGAESDNKNDSPLIQVVMPDESSPSPFSFFEGFHYRESQQNQHANSHDSLLQPDHIPIMSTINTAASSSDDLSSTHQLLSSAFHSKDSALGLSDDNLNCLQTNEFNIQDIHNDYDEDDDRQQQQQQQQQRARISLPLSNVQQGETVDNNEIEDNTNNYIEKNEMVSEHIPENNTIMMCITINTQLKPTSYGLEHAERTVSSSSSEQLIPKEKQTGMYYPAFGSSAAIHLAEKYNCEWLQDVPSPTSTIRKHSTIVESKESPDSRIFHQHQNIGDDDEFYLSLQAIQPSHSCPQLNYTTMREPLRERSYSLTTLDAYAYLDITRDTLEQMWLSLLDLAFSDKDDIELGEYKLRHIMGLSNSYTNVNETQIEKSRSHGDIFSSTNKNHEDKFTKKKSKSFDITSLDKSATNTSRTNESANVGLLQGAAISEPFVDRIGPSSTHSDTEDNLLDIDDDSIQSYEQDNVLSDEHEPPTNQITSPIIKEPLNYVFHYPHHLENNDDFDLDPIDDISNYLPNTSLQKNEIFGDEDKQVCMSLGFDDDEATAALAAAVQPRDTQAILSSYRPHSLSTIPSSGESQYESSDDSEDFDENLRRTAISINQEDIFEVDNSEEETDDDHGRIGSGVSSPQSKPNTPIQSRSATPSELNQPIKLSNFSEIDHDAWEKSISEPIYTDDLSIEQNNEDGLFTFTDNLTAIISLQSTEQQSQIFTTDQIESTIIKNELYENTFIEQINENNSLSASSREDYIEHMDEQQVNKSVDSTRTSISSIHDTHLDPDELAYRLARLDPYTISSPPKKTLADELAELGEKESRFENDSLDHTPPNEKKLYESYPTTPPLKIDQLTLIVDEIQKLNQEKAVSSLSTIVQDIHSVKNNQFLTKIVDYHQSPPISNLQTIMTELHEVSSRQPVERPQRPTHLELDLDEQVEVYEQLLTSSVTDSIPISSNIINNLEKHLAEHKTKTPSPALPPAPVLSSSSSSLTRRISEPPPPLTRYQNHRVDKVSDLEIVKQGNGFKIGYVDRQGTDQRVILTKRIPAGPDIMARDPHVRLPYKGRKILNQVFSSILYTNGYNSIQEDRKYQHSADDIEVPIIGTNPEHFDESDMISIDIDGPSTMLNSICESIVITQGSVYSNTPFKPSRDKPIAQPIAKSVFDSNILNSNASHLRHVVLDQHEEYLLNSSRTPTPSNKKDKIEVIDTWHNSTVIEGSSTTWRSPSLNTFKATKHIQPSTQAQTFVSSIEPNLVQMRIAPTTYDTKYRSSEHIEIPATYNWNAETVDTPKRPAQSTRDVALSPILIDQKSYQTSSTSTAAIPGKIDRSCQYSPPLKHEFGSQCHFDHLTSSTQVSSYDIPNFLITNNGTQTTINGANTKVPLDDSGIQRHMQTVSPSLSTASSDHQQTMQTGADFITKFNDHNNHTSGLTVTQYTDENYYLPSNDNNQTILTSRSATLERSADSGILVDEQLLRTRRNKANFALQVDIKGSSSDSEDVSEVTQRPLHRMKSLTNDDVYEHHSELMIKPNNVREVRQNSSTNDKRGAEHSIISAKEIEQQILQLRRERAHILDLLSLNWSRSNIWVELTEAKLNYIIGETDALLRSLSFDANPVDSERVKVKMHQYEEDMAELTRQRLAIYRQRLEDSKKQLDIKIDELELKKSSLEHHTSHYSTLEFTPRAEVIRHAKSFLSTSAENLSNIPLQDSVSSHPHLLDVSFLTSTPSNQTIGLPPRYPRSPRLPQPYQSPDTYRTVYRPTPRYPSAVALNTDQRYDFPRYRTTSYVTPNGNLSGLQGLSRSQQAILDETDKLVKDSQEFHNESASQFERARESLLSSEASIRLARANMAASRFSPTSNYLPNDVTLAELFKYEQSLAKETAKNTRTYSSISTSAES